MRIRTVFVEMTATPSILRRSLDSTLTWKDIVVIFNFKESLPSLLHNGKKHQCHPTLIYPHTVAFHHDLPRPPSKVHAFDKGRDKTWTVMSVFVLTSCQTQFWVSLFPVVSTLCWFLVSAACLCHPMLEQHRFFGSFCSLCRPVTSGWPSCLSNWRAELVKQRGGCAHRGGKLISLSTLASSPLEKRVKIFDDPCYYWGCGCIRITTRSLHPSINAVNGVIQTFPCFGCWLFPLLLQFGSLLLITPYNMNN